MTRQTTRVAAARHASPVTSRHRLGASLRHMRETRSFRLQDAAVKIGVSPSTLSRIEKGRTPPNTSHIDKLMDLYSVGDPEQRQVLSDLTREGQRTGWWDGLGTLLPAGAQTYLGLESAASHIRAYEIQTVPEILQTLHYTAAVLRATRPDLSDDEISVLLSVQRHRQQQLRAFACGLHVVLDESVLLRSIGSAKVMTDQLEHLLAVTDSSPVILQIARLTRTWTVLNQAFTLLSFPDPADPDVACGNGLGGQIMMTSHPIDVSALSESFEALAGSAISPGSSADLIGKIVDRSRT